MTTTLKGLIATLSLVVTATAPLTAAADPVADFYRNRTVTVAIGAGPVGGYAVYGCCQSNVNQSPKYTMTRVSRRKMTPFGQGGGAVFLEGFAAVQVTVEVEMIVDRGMGGGEFLQGLYVPEFRHRTLPSSEWLM